jgi:NAD(P)-dependent dehydrogenase (short-subunit alcohol dehydrogenase family)
MATTAPPLPPNLRRILDAEYPRFSYGEMARRRAAVEVALAAARCEHLVFCGANRAGSSVQWLTQWPVTTEAVGVLTPGQPDALFVQWINHAPLARKLADRAEVAWGGESSIRAAIAALEARGARADRVGVIGPMNFEQHAALAARFGKVDLLIANAGIGGGRFVGQERFEIDEQIVRTNLIGAMATIDAGVKLFRASGGGHIVAVSSVAAYRGLPGHGAYSASKAGLNAYLEAVRAEVQEANILVTTLAPGYIDTPLNQHMKSRPFLVTAEDGAKRAADLIERGVRVSPVPVFPWNAIGFVMRTLPDALWYRVMRSQGPGSSDVH